MISPSGIPKPELPINSVFNAAELKEKGFKSSKSEFHIHFFTKCLTLRNGL